MRRDNLTWGLPLAVVLTLIALLAVALLVTAPEPNHEHYKVPYHPSTTTYTSIIPPMHAERTGR